MQDRVVIFDSRVVFSRTAYSMASFKFTPGLPLLPWQRNLGQNRLQLGLYKRYQRDVCVQHGVFGVGLLNDARQILLRPTPVAMATKFGTKSAITRLI